MWLIVSKGPNRQGNDSEAILHAYDAADVSRELYSAVIGPSVRFAMPDVAGGRVYIGAGERYTCTGSICLVRFEESQTPSLGSRCDWSRSGCGDGSVFTTPPTQ